jgi:DNA-binding HxlR family transcriptional regulator
MAGYKCTENADFGYSEKDRFYKIMYVLGRSWNIQIMEILYQQPMRFCDLSNAMSHDWRSPAKFLHKKSLIQRLSVLKDLKIVEHKIDPIGKKIFALYSLTQEGKNLLEATGSIADWAEKNQKNF